MLAICASVFAQYRLFYLRSIWSLCIGIINLYIHISFEKKKVLALKISQQQQQLGVTWPDHSRISPLSLTLKAPLQPLVCALQRYCLLPELHFDALHQPGAKSMAGAEGRMTSVLLLFFNSTGYRHHTDKSCSKKTIQNVESKKCPASGRGARRALLSGLGTRVIKAPVVEGSLLLFSLNDINQHLTGICGISPPQKRAQ